MSRIIEVTLNEKGDTKTTLRKTDLTVNQYALILLDLITDISKMVAHDRDQQVDRVYHTLITELIKAVEEAPANPDRPTTLQ